MKKHLLIATLTTLIIISISTPNTYAGNTPDPAVNSLNMADYYPSEIGTWWKYEHYDTDSNSVGRELTGIDSTFVNNILILDGKNAIEKITIHLLANPVTKDTSYYSVENTSLYKYSDPDISFDDNKTMIWKLFADLVKTKWSIPTLDTALDFMGSQMKYSLSASMERTSNETPFLFKSKSLPKIEFKMIMDMLTSMDIAETGKNENNIQIVGYFTLVKGLGEVKTKIMKTLYKTESGSDKYGEESILIASSIK